MTSSIGAAGPSDFGLTSSLISDNAAIKQQLDRLTQQSSSGFLSSTYAGLGAGAGAALSLTPQIDAMKTWQSNITAAGGRMQVTQTAMTQLQSIASNLQKQLLSLSSADTGSVDTIAASARSALAQVGALLDTKDGDSYVFAGQDSATAPVPGPDRIADETANPDGFFAQIQAAVAGLAAHGASATAATTLTIAASNTPGTSPFSADLSQSAAALQSQVPLTQVGQDQTVRTGLLASANVTAVSSGQTTGSYMRDLMRALATVGSLTGAQAGASDFDALVQNTRTSMTGVISAMATDTAGLGDTQARMTATGTELSQLQTAVTSQLSDVQNTDMAATLSQLTQVQSQLQASYQVIASLSGLSLAKYLPAA